MTIEDVRDSLKRIKALSHDSEMAHTEEDNLRDSVLWAIAEGAPNAKELAAEALKSSDISFCRGPY